MARSRSANLLSQAEFSRRHGVSQKTVSTWKAAGYLVTSKGCVDVAKSEVKLRERLRSYRGGVARGPAYDSKLSQLGTVSDDTPEPDGVFAQAEAALPAPPPLKAPRVPATLVFDVLAELIGAAGRRLPTLAMAHGSTAREAYHLDIQLACVLADEAEAIADKVLRYTPIQAHRDWALAKTVNQPDGFWSEAAALNGDRYDADAWLASTSSTPFAL